MAGTWQALCDRVLAHDGTSVISHEILGGAEPDEIAAALAPLAGIDVDVVVTARDLGRQATAHWQEEVKLGDTRSFAELERDQFRADVPRGERPHFWHAQDYAAALRRWSTAVPAERVHLVVGPAAGRGARRCCGGGSRRRAASARRPRPSSMPTAVAPANRSLTTEAIALLRAGQPGARRSAHAARARPARQAGAGGGPAGRPTGYAAPDARRPWPTSCTPAAAAWGREIEAGGHPVHGSLDDLTPVLAGPGDPHPDAVPPGVPDPAEVADVVARSPPAGRSPARRLRP